MSNHVSVYARVVFRSANKTVITTDPIQEKEMKEDTSRAHKEHHLARVYS